MRPCLHTCLGVFGMSDSLVNPASTSALPGWAQEMRTLFRSGSVSQFILHGNIFDVVPAIAAPTAGAATGSAQPLRFIGLKAFLEEVMFAHFDVVLQYDRGKGIRATRGADDFGRWLDSLSGEDAALRQHLREPARALEIIDRYLLRTLNLRAISRDPRITAAGNAPGAAPAISPKCPEKIAVIIDFAQFVAPAGNALQLGGDFASNIVKILTWANDPAILQSNIVTVLLTEQLSELNDEVARNPHPAKLKIPLPDEQGMIEFIRAAFAKRPCLI